MMKWFNDTRDTGEGCTIGEARKGLVGAAFVAIAIVVVVMMAMKL